MFKQLFVKCTQQWEHNARHYGGIDMHMKQDQHLKYLVELTLEKCVGVGISSASTGELGTWILGMVQNLCIIYN